MRRLRSLRSRDVERFGTETSVAVGQGAGCGCGCGWVGVVQVLDGRYGLLTELISGEGKIAGEK